MKLSAAARPEYIYKPNRIWHRLRYAIRSPEAATWARAPGGLPVRVEPSEQHGRALLTLGVVDLRVTELVWRLVDEGDRVADIGANIGGIMAVLVHRAGVTGSVTGFEPHPKTRQLLERSVEQWSSLGYCRVSLKPCALSNQSGTAMLDEPPEFARNSGIARIAVEAANGHEVGTETFDNIFGVDQVFKLVKIDVEGHEEAVIEGMSAALSQKRIKHLIFEEHHPLPSRLCRILDEYGYRSFLIDRHFHGLRLVDVAERPAQIEKEATSVVATIDLAKLKQLVATRGWRCLRK